MPAQIYEWAKRADPAFIERGRYYHPTDFLVNDEYLSCDFTPPVWSVVGNRVNFDSI